ncbi:MAG: zeta toxin family protein [Bacteroidales bacterium]|nr:zeta toxin family protein [Bacteroidales bacterium]
MDLDSRLYIIAGCNGAGKTTASYTILPEILQCREFVNADEIAKGLSPFNPESMAIKAGRLMVGRINELLGAKESFALETTLATRSYTSLVANAHKLGYKVSLIYFWLQSPELAELRVAKRVQEGGHNIATNVLRRRYRSGINNLFNLYMPIVDYWMLFDNSQPSRVLIAEGGIGMETHVIDNVLYKQMQSAVDTTKPQR